MTLSTVRVEMEGVDAVIKKFKAIPEQIDRAGRRAVSKTLDQMQAKGRSDIAKAHDIPVRTLRPKAGRNNNSRYRGRVVKRKYKKGTGGHVWFGRNPIKSGYVGGIKNAPSHGGAFARKYFFREGFIASFRSGHIGVFKRDGSARKPITETTVALFKAESVIKKTAESSNGLFKKIFDRELNYEVNVRGRN